MPKEIILVAGLNYPGYARADGARNARTLQPVKAGPWREFCVRWARRAVKTTADLRVTLFDFHQGTRERITFDKQGKPAFTPEVGPTKLDFDNYRRWQSAPGAVSLVPLERRVTAREQPSVRYYTGIKERGAGPVLLLDYLTAYHGAGASPPAELSLSIIDVYAYLRAVGRDRPNTVAEFHIFAHGFAGGPILVNTLDLPAQLRTRANRRRDPLDKDGRASQDFHADSMSGAELADFKKAFAEQARSFVWGCNADRYRRRLVLDTVELMKTKNLWAEDRWDREELQFRWNKDWNVDQSRFHADLGGSPPDPRSAKKSVTDIIDLLTKAIDETYMQKLAEASDQFVLGAFPGTYSNFDKLGPPAERFLHVPRGTATGDGEKEQFTSVLNFYGRVLSRRYEPQHGGHRVFGRGYGVYSP